MPQFITVLNSTGTAKTFTIEEGISTFAGSANHCEINLEGSDVAPIHIMFSTVEGQLTVQDWNTNGQTLLNGLPLPDEAPFCVGDELAIGDNQILAGQHSEVVESEPRTSADTVAYKAVDSNAELKQELLNIRDQNSECESEFTTATEHRNSINSLYDDPFGSGDTELLRDEIESLTLELAERDQQLLMLNQQVESGGTSGDIEDTSRMVARMEQLLDELQSADGRIRTFEELLRASDDATQAEQEERRQLESWVNQIEDRVTAREEEANAETKRLNNRVHDLLTQQKHHEQVIENALQKRSSDGNEQSNELVQSLQEQVQDLQTKWQQSQQECERLLKQQATAPTEGESQSVAELNQKIMQLELDAARERAEVARERAELTRLKSELEQKHRTKTVDSDSDIRLKAMREHLREIHSEEETERAIQQQNSLGHRIASLFTRIESRQ